MQVINNEALKFFFIHYPWIHRWEWDWNKWCPRSCWYRSQYVETRLNLWGAFTQTPASRENGRHSPWETPSHLVSSPPWYGLEGGRESELACIPRACFPSLSSVKASPHRFSHPGLSRPPSALRMYLLSEWWSHPDFKVDLSSRLCFFWQRLLHSVPGLQEKPLICSQYRKQLLTNYDSVLPAWPCPISSFSFLSPKSSARCFIFFS